MNPFAAVNTMQCVGCTIKPQSGNPFGLRLAALRNEQDPGDIEAVAIRVPQGEVVEIRFAQHIKSFNVRTSCVGVAAHPECRGFCVPTSSGYVARVSDVAALAFMEPHYDIVNLEAYIVGSRPRVPILITKVTLGCHMFAAETVFDSIKVEV